MEKIYDFICKWLLIFLGIFASVGSFTEVFDIDVNMRTIIISELIITGTFLLFTGFGRAKMFVVSTVMLGILVCFMVYRAKQFINAIYYIANKVIDRYNDYFMEGASHYMISDNFKKIYITLFFVMVIVLYAYILTLVTYNRIYAAFHILMSVIFIFPGILFGVVPGTFYMVLLVIYGIICIMYQHNKKVYPARFTFVLVLSIGAAVLVMNIYPEKTYRAKDRYKNISSKFQKIISKIDMFNDNGTTHNFPAYGGVNGGRLGEIGKVTYTDTQMLKVKMNKNTSYVYLKGFTGTSYNGDYWGIISEDNLKAISEPSVLQSLSGIQYDDRNDALLYTPDFSNFADNISEMELKYSNAGKNFTYIPYYSDIAKNKDITFIKKIASGPATKDKYNYVFSNISESKAISKYNDRLHFYDGDYTDEMNELMKETNLDLPVSLVKEFDEKTGLLKGSYEYTEESLRDCIEQVRKYLSENTEYSLEPGELEGDDYVSDFLFSKKEGYCTAYASAATLLLRYMGVPARYAEGYLIKTNDEAEDADGMITVSVTDNDAHAWCEVYVPGAGFVPVEMTKGMIKENLLESEPETTKTEDEPLTENQPQTTVQPETVQAETATESQNINVYNNGENEKQAGGENNRSASDNKSFYYIIIVILLIVLIASLLTYKFVFSDEAKRRYTTDNYRHNVVVVGNILKKYLKAIGIEYEINVNTSDVCGQLNKVIKAARNEKPVSVDAGETREVLDIIDKSKYADENTLITEEEYQKVIKYYEELKNSLQYLKNRL